MTVGVGRWAALGAALVIAGALALGPAVVRPQPPQARAYPPETPAPEITGGPWINSGPLSLTALRGRVVLVEFWTYG
jgi:hypothetical protein